MPDVSDTITEPKPTEPKPKASGFHGELFAAGELALTEDGPDATTVMDALNDHGHRLSAEGVSSMGRVFAPDGQQVAFGEWVAVDSAEAPAAPSE